MKKQPKTSPDIKRVIGIDLGIASCGWAVLDLLHDTETQSPEGTILACGTWMFDAPETDKEKTPTNQLRRAARGQRRVIRRRSQRMNALRRLFAQNGLLPDAGKTVLKVSGLDPWKLRAEGLDRKLTGQELAITLAHIARHRGFKSNKKSDGANNSADDSSKMLKAIADTKELSARYRTVGEMVAKDGKFKDRKRNRSGDFSRSLLRADQEAEVRSLFAAQRRLGSNAATQTLEEEYAGIAFFQRPLQDSEVLLGKCTFEVEEKRTARRAPSFELFRYLSRLNALRIRMGRIERPLTADELRDASANFGKTGKITFKALRKLIGLDENYRFAAVSEADEKNDVAARNGEAAAGTSLLRKTIIDAAGEMAWASLAANPALLDRMAEIITFRDAPERIRAGLEEAGASAEIVDAIMANIGAFARFTGAAHISAKAARAIIPGLREGLTYDKACARAGYDHARQADIDITKIGSPVARKALSEAAKQVKALVEVFGVPDAIHVELARDVGKSADERREIDKGIKDRNAEKDRLRKQYEEEVGNAPRTAEDLLRFELWKQQGGRCIYTDAPIHVDWVASTDNRAQVDHILPWSRFGDDSFHNKVLVTAKANQEKKGRTPFEWFKETATDAEWDAYAVRVESNKSFRGYKKRNLLLKNADEVADRFRSRNLNDTRYAARALASLLQRKYPAEEGKRRVFARPGAITSKLRQAWGVQSLKKNEAGERVSDDRHHALDAIVCAATTESALQRLTRAFQEAERRGLPREIIDMPLPWKSFTEDARNAFAGIFVARSERRRARGKAHDATIKQLRKADEGNAIYERKAIEKLTLKDLDNVKDPDRNQAIIASLREWIEADKPKEPERQPRSHKGDLIRKVRVLNRAKDGVEITFGDEENARPGVVDRGEMVRVDVFKRTGRRGTHEYLQVPVYPHQLVALETAPNRFVVQGVPEEEWGELDHQCEYLFAIHSLSFIEIVKRTGELVEGYFRGLDRATGNVTVSNHISKDAITRGVGIKTLATLRKFTIDRLGNRHEVVREERTWRNRPDGKT